MEINGPATLRFTHGPRTPRTVKSRLLQRNCELPPIPAVAVELLSLLGKEQVSLAEVAATIAADATIAAEVLRKNFFHFGSLGS